MRGIPWTNRRLIGAKRFQDGLHRPVSPRLAPVFMGREALNKWINDANILRMQLVAWNNAPFLEALDRTAAIAGLDELISAVQRAVPHQECWCNADELHCPLCGGKRWLSVGKVLEASAEASRRNLLVRWPASARRRIRRLQPQKYAVPKSKSTKTKQSLASPEAKLPAASQNVALAKLLQEMDGCDSTSPSR